MAILKVKNQLGVWEDIPAIVGKTGATGPAGANTTASQVTNTPAGGIAAVTVQAAINELDTEKVDKALEAWTAPTLVNSWTQYSDRPAFYRKDNFGRVWLRGLIQGGTLNTVCFTLPTGYRPNTVVQYFVGGLGGQVTVSGTTGDVKIVSGSTVVVPLDSISFPTV